MNIETGKVEYFTPGSEPKGWVPLRNWPNPNCKHCHGKGHLGLVKYPGKGGVFGRRLCHCVLTLRPKLLAHGQDEGKPC